MNVHCNASVCRHAGVCVRTLPEVLQIEDGSFAIDSGAANATEVREVFAACPSGAHTASAA